MIYTYPEKIISPLNRIDGLCVFSIWRDRRDLIPRMKKDDVLHIETSFGNFYLSKAELDRLETFKQYKYRPEPMIMIRVKARPVSKEKEEKIENRDLISAIQ